jgi:hypothetical protein
MPVVVSVFDAALGAILATTVLVFLRPMWERHRRRLLRRMAWRARWRVWRLLSVKLAAERYRLEWRWLLSARQAKQLRCSFRVETRAGDLLDARELLRHFRGQTAEAYLLNADSGQGKTTFALTMALQRTRRKEDGLVPFYFDAAQSEFERDLERWVGRTSRATQDGVGGLADRALLIFDAINETVEATALARILSDHLDPLRANHVKLLLLFSSRRPGYAGGLVAALERAGIGSLQTLRLQGLDAGDGEEREYDLRCFWWLVGRRDPHAKAVSDLVAKYRERHRGWPLSRADIAAVTRWIGTSGDDTPPSPVAMAASTYLNPGTKRFSTELLEIARVAFLMLGDERSVCSVERVAEVLRPTPLSDTTFEDVRIRLGYWRNTLLSEIEIPITLEGRRLRIDSEAAIRVLGALHVAACLRQQSTPREMRGRTTYDVVAPYVPAALQWLDGLDVLAPDIVRHLIEDFEEAKSSDGPTAPYSFYGRLVAGPYGARASGHVARVLFDSIIEAIDRDRTCTCTEGIRKARRAEEVPVPDPVLDQLFELMAGCSEHAVEPLLKMTGDDGVPSLERSQAAYLLLAWIRTHQPLDIALRSEIAERLGAGSPNLHLRYHQAELVELLLDGTALDSAPATVLGVVDAVRRLPSEPLGGSPVCQLLGRAVSDYVTHIRDRRRAEERGGARASFDCASLSTLWAEGMLEPNGSRDPLELHLECWEVALGLSSKAFRHAGSAERWLSDPIVAALEHELWIVRWWAFGNLVELFRWSADRDLPVLAAEFAELIVAQLFRPGEPIGLKQRECAVVEAVLADAFSDPAYECLRLGIRRHRHGVVEEQGRRAFTNAYAEVLGQPAERYLGEYFGRIDRLLAQAL